MSQVKLTLRPPPNVDFVHGYPGIPPGGPERPQAAVKGAIEVRVGPQGVKAKWLRIELRKVETLPAGGVLDTFYDYVGPSPVNLWTSSDEYGLLRTQDFPFSIRIPESIPPSIMLENRAGIQYELVASLCTQGKKNFFRKRKSVVVSTQAAIIIDKHELHSTWPVYSQSETRRATQGGGTLIVERNQTCYGPGDRISVVATLVSDSLDGLILRGFELTLRETTIFNTGPYGHGGRRVSPPQSKTVTISDSKLAINAPLYPGTQHRAELMCGLSANHTTTTLNAARHIDVTYVLSVKAVVDAMPAVALDMPVVISNWPRKVSQVAIGRIGPAAGLSLIPLQPTAQSISLAGPSNNRAGDATAIAANLPASHDMSSKPSANANIKADEIGYGAGLGYNKPPTPINIHNNNIHRGHSHSGSTASSIRSADEFGVSGRHGVGTGTTPNHFETATGKSLSGGATSRFTIMNAVRGEIPETDSVEDLLKSRQRSESESRPRKGSGGSSLTATTGYPSAVQEKQRYAAARAKVEQLQGLSAAPPAARPARNSAWETAEQEKLRLWNRAQAAALQTQGSQAYDSIDIKSPAGVSRTVSASASLPSGNIESPQKMVGAALYNQAIIARNQALAKQQPGKTSTNASPPKNVPQFMTAEQEKAALKRYQQAKLAVDRVQNVNYPMEDAGSLQAGGSGPIAYEHLYPTTTAGGSSASHEASNDLPPPFEGPANTLPTSALLEKERLRRTYEQQDAAALARRNSGTIRNNNSPPLFTPHEPIGAEQIKKALSEKEILRRKYEAQDAAAAAAAATANISPPPRSGPITSSPTVNARVVSRPTPIPPSSQGVLTAAEEKALLNAQYAAQDRAAQQQKPRPNPNGDSPNRAGSSRTQNLSPPPLTPPSAGSAAATTPPPLMPRPPVEYIQETQEEDARVSLAMGSFSPSLGGNRDEYTVRVPTLRKPHSGADSGHGGIGASDAKPFSPFLEGSKNGNGSTHGQFLPPSLNGE